MAVAFKSQPDTRTAGQKERAAVLAKVLDQCLCFPLTKRIAAKMFLAGMSRQDVLVEQESGRLNVIPFVMLREVTGWMGEMECGTTKVTGTLLELAQTL